MITDLDRQRAQRALAFSCPLHPENLRPCHDCYSRAVRQRDAQRRRETAELHATYLAGRQRRRP